MTQPLGDEPDGRRAVVGRGQRVRLGSTRVMVIEAPSGWRPRRGLVGTVTELVGDGEARVVFRAR